MCHTNTSSNKDPNNQGAPHPFVPVREKNNGASNFAPEYGDAA
jgi:hypothetical protein